MTKQYDQNDEESRQSVTMGRQGWDLGVSLQRRFSWEETWALKHKHSQYNRGEEREVQELHSFPKELERGAAAQRGGSLPFMTAP